MFHNSCLAQLLRCHESMSQISGRGGGAGVAFHGYPELKQLEDADSWMTDVLCYFARSVSSQRTQCTRHHRRELRAADSASTFLAFQPCCPWCKKS